MLDFSVQAGSVFASVHADSAAGLANGVRAAGVFISGVLKPKSMPTASS